MRVYCSRGLESCKYLEELDLSGNRLADLGAPTETPPSEDAPREHPGGPLEALQRLHTLRLNSNRLTTLRGIEALPNLRELQVADNELTHVGAFVSNNKKLEKLNVAAN